MFHTRTKQHLFDNLVAEKQNKLEQLARNDAANVLRIAWDGSLPVDPYAVADAFGIVTSTAHLKYTIHSMTTHDNGRTHIVVNTIRRDGPVQFNHAREL